MKYFCITLTLLFAITAADAQVSSGSGIFGFGRKKEQINPGLFPTGPSQPVNVSSDVPGSQPAPAPRTSDNIFRRGAPQEVEAVSYVIEDGEKVEKATSEKKSISFFGFGKKDKADAAESAPVLDPVPQSNAPEPEMTSPAPAVAEVVEEPTSPIEIVIEEEAGEKKSGMFSFFNRKKKEADPVLTPQPVVAESPSAPAPSADSPAPAPAPQTVTEDPAPVVVTASDNEPASTDIPTFAGVDTPTKKKSGFSLPNPMKNFKAPPNPIEALRPLKKSKPIDMTGAETIIANGEIVEEQDDIVESNIVSEDSGTQEPPRIVNGVKTYSSWDDVGGSSTSAADRILNQIR